MKAIWTATAALAAFVCAAPATATTQASDPLVILHTARGDIIVRLDVEHAPVSTCNFLRYVRSGAYAGGSFFRTVVAATNANPHPIDVIQAATPVGSDDPGLGPVALERTRDTGLRHVAGTISMARDGPDTATSSFFIVVEDTPSLDFGGGRNPDGQGFAAFGQVISGMELVREIQRLPATDEQIDAPVVIGAATLATPEPTQCRA